MNNIVKSLDTIKIPVSWIFFMTTLSLAFAYISTVPSKATDPNYTNDVETNRKVGISCLSFLVIYLAWCAYFGIRV